METTVSRNHVLVASITLGDPPQELRCLLDSGSADLWMPSRHCVRCGSERSFRVDRSVSFMPELVQTPQGPKPRIVKMTYGTGEILGVAARDALHLGSWAVGNQSFIVVEDAELPVHLSWDGICGLAWSRLAIAGPPLYQRFQEQGHRALFSLMPATSGRGPQMVLGAVPREAMNEATLAWAKAEPLEAPTGDTAPGANSFWVTSGGVALGERDAIPARFLVDTGTNQVLLVPPKQFEGFMRALLPADVIYEHCGVDGSAGGLFICDCSVARAGSGLPPLRLLLGGKAFNVSTPEMFRRVTARDGGEDLCLLEIQPNRMATPATSVKALLAGLLKPEISEEGVKSLTDHLAGCCSWDDVHCGSTTNFCNANEYNCKTQCHGTWLPIDATPFPLPHGTTEVQEVTEAKPGGSVCKTWKVLGHGSVLRQETRCAAPGQTARRLRQAPGPRHLGPPPSVLAATHGQMDDLWVLGGVFLQRFVTIFDFDEGRMGFAEPREPLARAFFARAGLDALPQGLLGATASFAARPEGGVAFERPGRGKRREETSRLLALFTAIAGGAACLAACALRGRHAPFVLRYSPQLLLD